MGSRGSSSTTGQQPIPEPHVDLGELFPANWTDVNNKAIKSRENALNSAVKHMSQYDNEHWNALSPSEQAAVIEYTGTGHKDLNAKLQSGKKLTPKQETLLLNLDRATSKGLPISIQLKRGVELTDEKISQLAPGSIMESAGFSSTAAFGGVGRFGNTQIVIKAGRGKRGLVVNTHSKHGKETEVLLPRNAKFKVTSVSSKTYSSGFSGAKDYKFHTIHVELL